MAEFKKGAALAFGTRLILFFGMCLSLAGWAEATSIKSIRTGSEQAYVRMVIETNARLDPRPKISINRDTLQISLTGVDKDSSILRSEAYRDDVVNIEVTSDSKQTSVRASLAFVPIRVRTFFLNAPHRFVIDAYRPSSENTDEPLAEALKPISIIEEKGAPSNGSNTRAPSSKKEGLSKSQGTPSTPPPVHSNTDGSNQKDFQRHLLLFLILVTSIILVVIIFLMCMDKGRK